MKLDKTKKYKVGEVVFEYDEDEDWESRRPEFYMTENDLIALGAVEVEETKPTNIEKAVDFLLFKAYTQEFEVDDGQFQHPRGLNFEAWKEKMGVK